MNAGTFSGLVTAFLLLAFIVGWVWAFSAKRKSEFEAAARLPLEDQVQPEPRA